MVGPRGGNWKPLNASSEVRFAVIGATAAALFFVVSWSAQARGVPAFWAGLIAYGAAFTFGYLGHHSITFGSEHLHRRTMPRYAALQCICALLAAATSGLLARPHLFSAPEISASTTLVTGAFAYIGSRYWVFK